MNMSSGHCTICPNFLASFSSRRAVRAVEGARGGGAYTASESDLTYHHFLQLQIACRPDQASKIRNAIAAAAWTGRKDDGVIFATDATSFVRIREDTGATT